MNCPICEKSKIGTFYEDLLICEFCRHIFFRGLENLEESDLAEYYSSQYTYGHNQRQIQEGSRAYFQSHVKELMLYVSSSNPVRIVDYGCSYPFFLIEAKAQGCEAVGIEYDEDSRKFGTENGITMIAPNSDMKAIPDGSVDILRCSHVLEHAIDPAKILMVLSEKLKPGGIIYITQPSFPVYKYSHDGGYKLKDSVFPGHLHFFNVLSLVTMLEKLENYEIHKIFTHTNAEEVFGQYADYMDCDTATDKLQKYKMAGESFFPKEGNYPIYAGENSFLIARKVNNEVPNDLYNWRKRFRRFIHRARMSVARLRL